jgi:hypothetical protein
MPNQYHRRGHATIVLSPRVGVRQQQRSQQHHTSWVPSMHTYTTAICRLSGTQDTVEYIQKQWSQPINQLTQQSCLGPTNNFSACPMVCFTPTQNITNGSKLLLEGMPIAILLAVPRLGECTNLQPSVSSGLRLAG